ncbi:MAG: hypothetical protein AAGC54_09950 [Cyanobacteria bacterium P01_F01_bin.4]
MRAHSHQPGRDVQPILHLGRIAKSRHQMGSQGQAQSRHLSTTDTFAKPTTTPTA